MKFFPLSKFTRHALAWALAAIALFALVMGLRAESSVRTAQGASSLSQPGYLYRFGPSGQTFFTYTLPADSVPYGVAVTGTNPTHVWVALYGRNAIGHLIYTNTSSVQWIEHTITPTANSGPFQIAVHGNDVWFTERTANRIGHLDAATGELHEYSTGLSPNSGLADIVVAAHGRVWAAGQFSNRLIGLVVTSTLDYSIREYTHTLLIGPFGMFAESDNAIWFAAPGSARVGRFTPSTGFFLWPIGFPADGTPYEIVANPAFVWFTDSARNAIGQLEVGTLTNLNYYGPITRPMGLANESSARLWFTQQSSAGAVGRLIYTSTVATQLDSYPLPVSGLTPWGIAVASDGGVWFSAFAPFRIYLPEVLRNASS
jgi:streptogramin lyase